MTERPALERYRIGDVTLSLTIDEPSQFEAVHPDFCAYEVDDLDPVAMRVDVRASVDELPCLRDAELAYERGSYWSAHRLRGRRLFVCHAVDLDPSPWRVLISDRDATRWEIITRPLPWIAAQGRRLPHPFAFPGAELLMLAHLASHGAAILHACGVVDREGGYLFCGRSGAGKSTTAGLWQDSATVLNDDRVLLRREEREQYRIYGTPWHGDFPRTDGRGAPLQGVFFLEKSDRHEVERVPAAEAHRLLLTSVWMPLWDGEHAVPDTIALCAQLAREVPCFRLRFARDAGACDAVRDALSNAPPAANSTHAP